MLTTLHSIDSFQSLIKEHPSYTDCHMRLAYIELKRNNLDKAEEWFREVISGSAHARDVEFGCQRISLTTFRRI